MRRFGVVHSSPSINSGEGSCSGPSRLSIEKRRSESTVFVGLRLDNIAPLPVGVRRYVTSGLWGLTAATATAPTIICRRRRRRRRGCRRRWGFGTATVVCRRRRCLCAGRCCRFRCRRRRCGLRRGGTPAVLWTGIADDEGASAQAQTREEHDADQYGRPAATRCHCHGGGGQSGPPGDPAGGSAGTSGPAVQFIPG